MPPEDAALVDEAYAHMQLQAGQPIAGTRIDVAFIGSCTNGRIEDLRAAAEICQKHGGTVPESVQAFVVPGSEAVKVVTGAEDCTVFTSMAGSARPAARCAWR